MKIIKWLSVILLIFFGLKLLYFYFSPSPAPKFSRKALPPHRSGSIIVNGSQVNFPSCDFAKGISSRGMKETVYTLSLSFFAKKSPTFQWDSGSPSYKDIDTGEDVRPIINLYVATPKEINLSAGVQVFPSGGGWDRLINFHSAYGDSLKEGLNADDAHIVIDKVTDEGRGRVLEGRIYIKREIQAPITPLRPKSMEKEYDFYEKQVVYFECGEHPQSAY